MNRPDHNPLEAEVDSLLKSLPELTAPGHLLPQVLARLATRSTLPWYRQPWLAWPVLLRAFALAFLLASFGALCVACFQLTRAAGFANAVNEIAQTFSWVGSLWNVLSALVSAVALTIKHFGTWFIAGCCFAGALGYAICVGLGTACVRLAYAKK